MHNAFIVLTKICVVGDVSGSGSTWSLSSKEWDSDITAGDTLELRFIVGFSSNKVLALSLQTLMTLHEYEQTGF